MTLLRRSLRSNIDADTLLRAAGIDAAVGQRGVVPALAGHDLEPCCLRVSLWARFHNDEVTVLCERDEVTARKNLAEWDKAYAQQLLEKIIAKS